MPDRSGPGAGLLLIPLIAAALLFGTLLFKHLSYPLLWHDEAETAMFARRVLTYGYPRIHGPRNVVYSLWHRGGVGVHEATDAYTGSPWAQYYFGAIGVALSDRVDDLYAKTALLRLPFAATGFLALLLLGAAVLPSLGDRARRRLFAILLLLLFCYSVGLILHLREARYYSLVALLSAGVLFVYLRHTTFGSLEFPAYTSALAALLFLLFNTFYPAFTVLLIAIGLHRLGHAWRDAGGPRERALSFLRETAPLWIAVVAVLPLLSFFDFLEQARGWVERFGKPETYLENLRFVGAYLLRYEFLAPALVLRCAVAALGRDAARRADSQALGQRLDIAGFLSLLLATYALFIAQTPFLFERYLIVLSPLLTTLLGLDAFSLVDVARIRTARGVRGTAYAAAALAALSTAVGVWVRAPEFAGRLVEIRHPYRGPLDYVIPYLAETYPDVQDLVIATNYEDPSLMFYLGSRVTVGYYGADLERDRELQPDVIVPRPWPDHLELLRDLSERVPYRTRSFPVVNLWWNNVPSLMPRGRRQEAHQFRTRVPSPGEPELVILERSEAAEAGRQSSTLVE